LHWKSSMALQAAGPTQVHVITPPTLEQVDAEMGGGASSAAALDKGTGRENKRIAKAIACVLDPSSFPRNITSVSRAAIDRPAVQRHARRRVAGHGPRSATGAHVANALHRSVLAPPQHSLAGLLRNAGACVGFRSAGIALGLLGRRLCHRRQGHQA
jgi:hypothetical protein